MKQKQSTVRKRVATQKIKRHPWRTPFFFGNGPSTYKRVVQSR
jgi:hypothetical protein